jgi:hypothetical protein
VSRILQQSCRVLNNTGNIFLFSTPELNADFHSLLRRFFGQDNYVAEFVVPHSGYSRNLGRRHDSIIMYRRSGESVYNKRVAQVGKQEIERLYPFSDVKGKYGLQSLTITSLRGSMNEFVWEGITPKEGTHWRYPLPYLNEMKASGRIEFRGKVPQLKRYLAEADLAREVGTIWDDIELTAGRAFFPDVAAKPIKLLERIVLLGSNSEDTVVDPFCGSGAMLIAVANVDRSFLACDISEKMVALSMERLAETGVTFSTLATEEIGSLPVQWDHYKTIDTTEEDEVVRMILSGENAKVEFKASSIWNYYTKARDPEITQNILKSVSAFLNSAAGGTLFIGVTNDGDLIDLKEDFVAANTQKKNQDGYSLFLNQKIRMECGPSVIDNYSVKYYRLNNKTICRIDILPSRVPVFCSDDFYVRNDNHSVKLSTRDSCEYISLRFGRSQLGGGQEQK